jgi:hypothetical protein
MLAAGALLLVMGREAAGPADGRRRAAMRTCCCRRWVALLAVYWAPALTGTPEQPQQPWQQPPHQQCEDAVAERADRQQYTAAASAALGVVVVTYDPVHAKQLRRMLTSFEANYNCLEHGGRPIYILYHDASAAELRLLQRTVAAAAVRCGRTHLVNISAHDDGACDDDGNKQTNSGGRGLPHLLALQRRRHRSLCRFWAGPFATLPSISAAQFYWRLAGDSELLEPLHFDPFELMQRRNLSYVYRLIVSEPSRAVSGLRALCVRVRVRVLLTA